MLPLYGATAGYAFIHGKAGERFAVRNSGVHAVVEGIGDHGCEYMTGGIVINIGDWGKNFAAGMSGGMAFIFDTSSTFAADCNMEMVDLEEPTIEDVTLIRKLIRDHYSYTSSAVALSILEAWQEAKQYFIKVMPKDYKAVLLKMQTKNIEGIAIPA